MCCFWKVQWCRLSIFACLAPSLSSACSEIYLSRGGVNAADGSPRSVTPPHDRRSSSVSNSLQAMPRPHPSTPRSTETSSSPPPCQRQSCSATPPATHCPRRTAKLRWCTSPWASCPDLRPPASTIRRSTGERPPTLQQPWPSYHTQVRRAARQHITTVYLHNVSKLFLRPESLITRADTKSFSCCLEVWNYCWGKVF